MAMIVLSRGRFALVDDVDLERLQSIRWFCAKNGYAVGPVGSRRFHALLYMHRFIMGAKSGEYCDHINRNKLDNRRSNLRLCTASENCINTGPLRKNRSGFKGVSWHQQGNKWQSTIQFRGKSMGIGLFRTVEEAALAYNRRAFELFGEYAYLNEVS